jgi:MFS family permease
VTVEAGPSVDGAGRTDVPLWKGGAFPKLWVGQTVSVFGTRVSYLATPLTAVFVLHAGSVQMGLLAAAGNLAVLVFGLPAGVWADRVRRRRLMVGADVCRAVALASVPVAAIAGVLSMGQLLVVVFVVGGLGVVFDAAYGAALPSLVPRANLVAANSAMEASSSVAQVAGPGLGGALVGLLTAPVAIGIDALSFLVSAGSLLSIGGREEKPERESHVTFGREVVEGLRVVWRDRALRSLAIASGTFNLFDSVLIAIYILYMTRTLHMASVETGLVFGLGGVGGLLGAVVTSRLTAMFGVGRTLIGALVLAAVAELGVAFAGGGPLMATVMLIALEGCVELGATVWGITVASVRQAVTPERLLGRVTATSRFLVLGVTPVGAIAGGVLGETVGLRGAVLVAGAGSLLAAGWVVVSPLRGMEGLSG